MILSVRANRSTFREVTFQPGMNVIIADKDKRSSNRESRNGVGKSTLFQIIHFCLGASLSKKDGLPVDELHGWAFTVDLQVGRRTLSVTRRVVGHKTVQIEGDVDGLDGNRHPAGGLSMDVEAWKQFLGREMFDIPPRPDDASHWPSFRELLAYLARVDLDNKDPFEWFKRQQRWSIQVHNAYHLGLNWEWPLKLEELARDEKTLKAVKRAAGKGLVGDALGSRGAMEAEELACQQEADKLSKQLESFRVHPQYESIEKEANDLTRRISELNDLNRFDRQRLQQFEASIREDHLDDQDPDEVVKLYEEAKVQLPERVVRHLAEVQAFHQELIANRRRFLEDHIRELKEQIAARDQQVKTLSDKRAGLLNILKDHGALEHYHRLQERLNELKARARDLRTRIERLDEADRALRDIKARRRRLYDAARQHYEERKASRSLAGEFFDAHSKALYEAPGRLIIDLDEKGYRFDVKIQRARSGGISRMGKVFCYDLTLARLWAQRGRGPGFILHDSAIFNGVDERQIVHALQLASRIAHEEGFQYICSINTDRVPYHMLPPDFDLDQYVRLRLTDGDPAGSLLGIRF